MAAAKCNFALASGHPLTVCVIAKVRLKEIQSSALPVVYGVNRFLSLPPAPAAAFVVNAAIPCVMAAKASTTCCGSMTTFVYVYQNKVSQYSILV
jgi:hypothetical protein